MSALPSLRQLKYLIAIGETQNFTRAAEACFVGQSTLSTGLKELEDTLGAQLVERNRQTVQVTPLGAEIIERSKHILSSAQDMVDYVKGNAQPMFGTIRLGVIPTIAPFMLPKILPDIRQEFPNLKLALREDLTANLLNRLRNRQLDFALIALPYDTEGLIVKELFGDEFWLAAREGDDAFKGKNVTVPAKMAERLLLLEEGHCLREHSLAACKRTEVANSDGIEATSLLTLVQMVESGLGIALLPEMAVKGGILSGTGLTAKPLAAPVPKRVIALVARDSTAKIDEFNLLAQSLVKNYQLRLKTGSNPTKNKSTKN